MTTESIDIQLLGRQFNVAIKPEEKETFKQAVVIVDEKFKQLANKTASGGETLALMAALNIAHEFVMSQQSEGVDLPSYQRRINSMIDRVDQALAKQEKLF